MASEAVHCNQRTCLRKVTESSNVNPSLARKSCSRVLTAYGVASSIISVRGLPSGATVVHKKVIQSKMKLLSKNAILFHTQKLVTTGETT